MRGERVGKRVQRSTLAVFLGRDLCIRTARPPVSASVVGATVAAILIDTTRTGAAMTEIPRTYPQGVTSWIDTEQPDPEAASRFYGELFGWQFENAAPPGAPAYLIGRLDGKDAAAIAAGPAPARWNTYIAVTDADETARTIADAGGAVLAQPADAGPAGRAAICADPQGAEFRLWQAGRRLGVQAVNSPGAWNFSDIRTPDTAASRSFYSGLFGWRYLDLGATVESMIAVPGYGDHLAATADPRIRERQAGAPEGFADVIGAMEPTVGEERAHWRVKISVFDRAAAIASATRLGATVLATDDQVWALLADIRDPQGAEFTISEFREAG